MLSQVDLAINIASRQFYFLICYEPQVHQFVQQYFDWVYFSFQCSTMKINWKIVQEK